MSSFDKKNLLYHYTTKDKAIQYILNDMKLKFSLFKDVNDPKEYMRRDIGFNYISEELHNSIGSYRRIFNKILLNDSRVLCFTEDSIDKRNKTEGKLYSRGFFKLRMWSQYGDGNKGICLGFDKDILLKKFKEISSSKKYESKIYYTNSTKDLFKSCYFNFKENNSKEFEQSMIDKHIKHYKKQLYFTKALDWKDENEYRLVLLNESTTEQVFIDISEALKVIVLGIDFPDVVYKECIKKLINGKDIEVVKIDISFNGIPSYVDINILE